jgi:Ca2+-dependent lipid-binding protein
VSRRVERQILKLTHPRSSVQTNTLSPIWNELWKVNRVPWHASLVVKVYDKDEGVTDDYIGQFTTSVNAGARECAIEGIRSTNRGTFWIKVSLSFRLSEKRFNV